MTGAPYERTLIVGAGPGLGLGLGLGLGASLARTLTGECAMRVAVAPPRREFLETIAAETGAVPLAAGANNAGDVGALFEAAVLALGGARDRCLTEEIG